MIDDKKIPGSSARGLEPGKGRELVFWAVRIDAMNTIAASDSASLAFKFYFLYVLLSGLSFGNLEFVQRLADTHAKLSRFRVGNLQLVQRLANVFSKDEVWHI